MSVRPRTWSSNGVEHKGWVADYRDVQGVRRNKQFRLKKEAEAFAKRSGVEVMDGVHVADRASGTVAEAARNWLLAKSDRERSTVNQCRQHVDLHIVPLIGAVRRNSLTLPMVSAFEKRLRAEGRSVAMVRKIMVSLGSLLEQVAEDQLVVHNVMRGRRRHAADGR